MTVTATTTWRQEQAMALPALWTAQSQDKCLIIHLNVTLRRSIAMLLGQNATDRPILPHTLTEDMDLGSSVQQPAARAYPPPRLGC